MSNYIRSDATSTGIMSRLAWGILAILLVAGSPGQAMGDTGPTVRHVPETAAVSGAPFPVACQIILPDGRMVTSAVVLVRLTDAGTPVKVPLQPGTEEAMYQATIPFTMFKGLSVFWYSIDVWDDSGESGGTPWIRVIVAEPVNPKDPSTKLLGGKAGWVAGGVLLAGGSTAALLDDDDSPRPPPEDPPAEEKKKPKPCTTPTGNETVEYTNLEGCGFEPILIQVCGTCENATIRAEATWEQVDEIVGYNNPACSPTGPVLTLPKPEPFPGPEAHTISVYVNGVLIATQPWPVIDCAGRPGQ